MALPITIVHTSENHTSGDCSWQADRSGHSCFAAGLTVLDERDRLHLSAAERPRDANLMMQNDDISFLGI